MDVRVRRWLMWQKYNITMAYFSVAAVTEVNLQTEHISTRYKISNEKNMTKNCL